MSQTLTVPAPVETVGHAKTSSFYLAMRILPKPKREAMYEVYAFCRKVDDIADEGGPRPARHAALDQWRAAIDAIYAGKPPQPDLQKLAVAIRAFDLRREDFLAIIDGMEMDVAHDIRAPDWSTLELYCDRVASAVGRLSVRIFGVPATERDALAHHLGNALQLTNILRDIDEDAANGRLYLPVEALEGACIGSRAPLAVAADPRLAQACEPVVARARDHFRCARDIMARCSRASVKAPRIMADTYETLFTAMLARGFNLPRRRVRVSKARFLTSVLRYGLI